MTRRITWLAVLALGAALPACYVDVHEESPDEADYATPEAATVAYGGWEKLAEKTVSGRGRVDRDSIRIGRGDRDVTALMFVVRDAPVDLREVTIRFEDGSTYTPHLRHVMRENSRSYEVHLPAGRGEIRSIAFRYANLPGEGRANVEVWGR